ncbi:hypothetical protein V8E55_011855, partial [Tylopilus felleus]
VAVKDTWIDPLRKYTEGAILRMLNKAGIKGIPTLIYEGQVSAKVYDKDADDQQTTVNHSTHLIRAILEQYASSEGTYQLWVLYCLVTEPVGFLVTDFRSLTELLVTFLDFVVVHKGALEKARILHCNISLVNLLLAFIPAEQSDHHSFMDHIPSGSQLTLCEKISKLQR